MAKMLGSAVRRSSSTATNPPSTLTAVFSSPRPSTTAPRPTASSMTSALSSVGPSSPLTLIRIPSPDDLTDLRSIAAPAITLMPRLLKLRVITCETSGSSLGAIRGSASTTVTSAPRSDHNEANSRPTAPAPTTIAERGTSPIASAWSLLMTRLPSSSTPGRLLAYDPVATMKCPASSVRFPDSPVTVSFCAESKAPLPVMVSILFFFIRNWRPLCSWSTIFCLRAIAVGQSSSTPATLTPTSAPLRASWYTSAVWSSALVGMQPWCRQVPPSLSRSTRATLIPSWAARMAAT